MKKLTYTILQENLGFANRKYHIFVKVMVFQMMINIF